MKKSDIRYGAKVEGGKPFTEDFDQGKITGFDGEQVEVSWQSGVTTVQAASLLRLGWSERWLGREEVRARLISTERDHLEQPKESRESLEYGLGYMQGRGAS